MNLHKVKAVRPLYPLIIFALVIFGAHVAAVNVCAHWVEFDCPPYYPLSVFYPRTPAAADGLVALGVMGMFAAAMRHLSRVEWRLRYVMLWGLALVLGSNLIQDWERAFAVPIAGEPLYWHVGAGHEYYHDALNVTDALTFIRHYEQLQPNLGVHAKSHPPGAVLTLWLLTRLTPDPALIGILIACGSVLLTAHFLWRILYPRRFAVFLFLLIPAVQIYSAASLDALIAALLTGTLYYAVFAPNRVGIIGGVICLTLASFMTFGAVFIVPVLVGFALWRRRDLLPRVILILGSVGFAYALLYALSGFDYLAAFRIASTLENPDGFRLFTEPVGYVFTRIENVLEISLFFSPFLCLRTWRGWHIRDDLTALALLGLGTLLAMFTAGAFRTGETARACLFLYPYLFFPAALTFTDDSPPRDKMKLCALVFGQTLLMQLFGGYFW